VVNITSVTSNLSEIEQSSESASSICTETKLLEDREVDEFLDSTYKEKRVKENKKKRERKRKKKIEKK
ncbi:10647_t:CDS:1, partial [Cetraspora pellucida]